MPYAAPDDLWLEDATSERTRAFIERENARTAAALEDELFTADVPTARAIIEDPDKLFMCRLRAGHFYDFHRDETHSRGVWRRVPEIVTPSADAPWEVVFDLDAYCTETRGEWAWRGVADCGERLERVMMYLADGGSDVGVWREFDLAACEFVPGGFETPPAKGYLVWEDADTLLVTLATPGHATSSSWPSTVRRWRRGTDLANADELLRADDSDLSVRTYAVGLGERRTIALSVIHDINGTETLQLLRSGELEPVDLPTPRHAAATSRGVMWQPLVDTDAYPAGTLLWRSLPTDGPGRAGTTVSAGKAADDLVLFQPSQRRVARSFWASDRWVRVAVSDNLTPELYMFDCEAPAAGLHRVPLPEGYQSIGASWANVAPDHERDHRVDVVASSMTEPSTLLRFDPTTPNTPPSILRHAKARFDAADMRSTKLEVRSDDGTMVPYHLALPPGDGPHPVVIDTYGGFGIATTPTYLSFGALIYGQGVGYCFAHIRGGGEFGPGWHRSAVRHQRHKAFEDCAAVARDLVERGTAPAGKVGMRGGSNGGLLAGVMLTRYPERFGAIVAKVPVADMLRYHLFPAGRAWVDEYGDPDDEADAAYLRSYSPVHRVVPFDERPYPPILIDAPINDDRVDPSHARRFAHRLMEAGQPVFLRTSGTGGHGGGDASDAQARNIAAMVAFFRRTLLDDQFDRQSMIADPK